MSSVRLQTLKSMNSLHGNVTRKSAVMLCAIAKRPRANAGWSTG